MEALDAPGLKKWWLRNALTCQTKLILVSQFSDIKREFRNAPSPGQLKLTCNLKLASADSASS